MTESVAPVSTEGLLEISDFLPTVLETLDALVVVLDAEGRICLFNRACEELTGYASSEIVGRVIWEVLIPSEASAGVRAVFDELVSELSPNRYQNEWLKKDGSRALIAWSNAIIFDSDSVPRFVVGTGIDLSYEARVLETMRSEGKFRHLLESAPDAMVLVDASGNISLVNSQTERQFGYSRDELVGQPVEMLIPDRFSASHSKHRTNYFQNPSVRPMGAALELFGKRKDGSEFPVEVSLSPLKSEDGILAMSAIRDVTQRKVAEQRLRESLEEKEVLIKEVHHRVKNNLQVISSILKIQARTVEDEHAREIFSDTEARVRSMALVHERLYRSDDLTKITFEEYLSGLVEDLIQSLGIDARKIAITVTSDPLMLDLDRAINIGLIVSELVSNACKYAFPEEQRGTIAISLERQGEHDMQLTVTDSGVGFNDDQMSESTGSLGLKIVRGLARELDGTLTCSGEAGGRFVLTCPANMPGRNT